MRRSAIGALVALCAAAACLATAVIASASPAAPNTIHAFKQPNGTVLKLRLWGDEFVHGWETVAGYTVARDGIAGTGSMRRRSGRGRSAGNVIVGEGRAPLRGHLRPTQGGDQLRSGSALRRSACRCSPAPNWAGGDTDILFIMALFTDLGCSFTPARCRRTCSAALLGARRPRRLLRGDLVRDVQLVGTVVGDQRDERLCGVANNRAFYNDNVANPDGDDDFVREALADIDAYVNFADYDNDGDGTSTPSGSSTRAAGRTTAAPAGTNGDNLWPHSGGVAGSGRRRRTRHGQPLHHQLGGHVPVRDLDVRPDPDDRSLRARARAFARAAGPLRHRRRQRRRAHLEHDGLPVPRDAEHRGHAAALRPVEQIVPGLGHAGRACRRRPLRPADPAGRGHGGAVHEFLDNPGGVRIGGLTASTSSSRTASRRCSTRRSPGCGLLVWHVDESTDGQPERRAHGRLAPAARRRRGGRARRARRERAGRRRRPVPGLDEQPPDRRHDEPELRPLRRERLRRADVGAVDELLVDDERGLRAEPDAGRRTRAARTRRTRGRRSWSRPPARPTRRRDTLTYEWDLDNDGQLRRRDASPPTSRTSATTASSPSASG